MYFAALINAMDDAGLLHCCFTSYSGHRTFTNRPRPWCLSRAKFSEISLILTIFGLAYMPLIHAAQCLSD